MTFYDPLVFAENPVHHSPYFRQLMQEEYESKNVHSSPGGCDKKMDSKNSVEKLEQSSDSKTESENLTTNSDIKTDVVKMINNKSCDVENDKQLVDNDKQLADNDKQLNENPDCTGDAGVTGASTNIPKSSEAKHKEKKAKQPSKEERLGEFNTVTKYDYIEFIWLF